MCCISIIGGESRAKRGGRAANVAFAHAAGMVVAFCAQGAVYDSYEKGGPERGPPFYVLSDKNRRN